MIRKAEMENFRGYGDKNNSIEFKPGINLVLGDNATGKSTIVTLMMLNLLNKKIDVTKYEDYRTIEPEDAHCFRSKLSLLGIDGKEYAVEKTWSGKGSVKNRVYCEGKELKKCGQYEFGRLNDVQEFIAEKFGARREILEDILIQGQDPVRLLWPVRDSAFVGKELSGLLRLEELQNIFANAKSAENMLEKTAEGWKQDAIEVGNQIEDRKLLPPQKYSALVKRLQSKKDRLKTRSADLESRINEAKGNRVSMQAQLDKLRKASGELDGTLKRMEQLKTEVKGIRKPRIHVKELEQTRTTKENKRQELQRKLGDVRQKIGELKNAEQAAQRGATRLRPQQTSCMKEYSKLAKELTLLGLTMPARTIKDIKKLLKAESRKQEELGEKIGGLKQEIKTENDYRNTLSQAKAICPVCDTRLTPKHRDAIIAKKIEIIQGLKKRMKEGREESAKAKKIVELLDDVERTLNTSADIANRLSEAESQMAAAGKKLPSFEKRRARMEKLIESLESAISKIERQIEIAEKFSNIFSLKTEIGGLKTKLKALPRTEKEIKRTDSEIEKLGRNKENIAGEIRELGPKIESANEKLSDSEYWYGKQADIQYRTQTAYEFADEVKLAHEAAKLSLYEAFNNYCNMINSSLGWVWPRLYGRTDVKQIELNAQIKEIEEDGEQTLIAEVQLVRSDIKGNKLAFNTISSHGQRVLSSIAFRVAFLNLLSKTSVPRVLVLDEPTIWVDEKNRERLGQVLGTLVKEIKEGGIKIDQVIVVSHDSAFLNAIDPEASKWQCVKNSEGYCEVAALE
jgi:DNA repair exonuclease SbcCD ATPase subunit